MAIVSSTYSVDAHEQRDGRKYCREVHIDSVGGTHVVEYLADTSTDYVAVMNARAVQLSESLAEQEFVEVLSGLEP